MCSHSVSLENVRSFEEFARSVRGILGKQAPIHSTQFALGIGRLLTDRHWDMEDAIRLSEEFRRASEEETPNSKGYAAASTMILASLQKVNSWR